jgi:guanylate kinase
LNSVIDSYRTPPPVLAVVSGPSAVGKDTILSRIRDMGLPIHVVVTATTRKKRENEVEGRDYYFITDTEYDRLLTEGEFLEHASVYGAHRYGVPKAPIRQALNEGRDVVMRIDPIKGAATVRRIVPDAVLIFLAPPSLDELERRLRDRQNEINYEERRTMALAELQRMNDFQYIVVNERDCPDSAATKILSILTAEKCRAGRQAIVL